jgi:hypothetical protein
MSTSQQFKITEASISADRFGGFGSNSFDVRTSVAELNVFESLDKPYLTGTVVILDDKALKKIKILKLKNDVKRVDRHGFRDEDKAFTDAQNAEIRKEYFNKMKILEKLKKQRGKIFTDVAPKITTAAQEHDLRNQFQDSAVVAKHVPHFVPQHHQRSGNTGRTRQRHCRGHAHAKDRPLLVTTAQVGRNAHAGRGTDGPHQGRQKPKDLKNTIVGRRRNGT